MKQKRYDLAVFINRVQIAQICIDIDLTNDNIFTRAKVIMKAITDDKLAYVRVYSEGQFEFEKFND